MRNRAETIKESTYHFVERVRYVLLARCLDKSQPTRARGRRNQETTTATKIVVWYDGFNVRMHRRKKS